MARMDDGEDGTHEPDIRDKYRAVLTKGVGLEVLSDILAMCHFGCTLDSSNPQQIGEYNIGVAILAKCNKGVEGGTIVKTMLGLGASPRVP